jgi:hypothetical protein
MPSRNLIFSSNLPFSATEIIKVYLKNPASEYLDFQTLSLKVNKTFEELDKIHQFAKTWVNSPLNLTSLLGDLQNTNNIKVKQNLNQSL